MSERNPARFNTSTNAQNRSLEEQHRLMAEFEAAEAERYESAFSEDDYNEAMNRREKTAEAAEFDANVATEGRIMENVKANRMYMMSQQVAELRANGGEPEIIKDKENKLEELINAYAEEAYANHEAAMRAAEMERDTVKGREIRAAKEAEADAELAKRLEEADFIINSTDNTWVEEKLGGAKSSTEVERLRAGGELPHNPDGDDDDELEKLRTGGELPHNPDGDEDDDELKKLRDDGDLSPNPDDTPKADEVKRDGEESYLSKEDALKEAYDEYEKVEGTPYDVDKDRVKDVEDAHEQAIAEYESRTGEAYDVDKGREKDVEKAHDMAIAEDQDRTLGTAAEVWDEAHEENDRRNAPKLKWWKNPGAYIGAMFTVRSGEAMEKWRGSRRTTKIAIGVVAIAAAAGLVKLGYDLFNDPNVDPNNLPDGSGKTPGTPPEVPTTPEVPTPKPETFSDAARLVENGEGWYQTFNEMNIPQSEWSELLNKVGPDLAENGWAYKMPNGEWGISQPGKLPQDMLELIQRNR